MVVFISGSPRKDRTIHTTLKRIADQVDAKCEIISFSGKKISGCIGCELCASDNQCKLKDDWQQIAQKMQEADIIVFGAPNYFNSLNALSHAFWERTFSFKHQGAYPLKGKRGIVVTAIRDQHSQDNVAPILKQFMSFNKMEVIGELQAVAYDPCYTCGYGHNCMVGNVVKKHGVLDKIEPIHCPPTVDMQPDTLKQISIIADTINKAAKEL